MKFVDKKFVLIALFRYSLPRFTYAVGIAIDNLKLNWEELDQYAKESIIREIEENMENIDQRSWKEFLSWAKNNNRYKN